MSSIAVADFVNIFSSVDHLVILYANLISLAAIQAKQILGIFPVGGNPDAPVSIGWLFGNIYRL